MATGAASATGLGSALARRREPAKVASAGRGKGGLWRAKAVKAKAMRRTEVMVARILVFVVEGWVVK